MTETTTPVQKKLLQMKALLGDKAAQDILDQAAEKEALAQKAGVEFKEKKVTTKAEAPAPEKAAPLSLADVLAQIEAGLEAGTITNDLEESDEVVPETETDQKEQEAQVAAFKALIGEVLDAKLSAFAAVLQRPAATTEKEVKPDPRVAEIETKLKEAEEQAKQFKAALAELQGDQPKSAAYRASQADSTVVKESNLNAPHNGHDAVGSFITDFVMGGASKQAVQP